MLKIEKVHAVVFHDIKSFKFAVELMKKNKIQYDVDESYEGIFPDQKRIFLNKENYKRLSKRFNQGFGSLNKVANRK